MLCNQLETDIKELVRDIDDRFEFCHVDDPQAIEAIGIHNIYILDEADLTAERFITFDSEGNLNGLFNLVKASKVYFFSATMPKYFRELFG